jgi:hypothetical protein
VRSSAAKVNVTRSASPQAPGRAARLSGSAAGLGVSLASSDIIFHDIDVSNIVRTVNTQEAVMATTETGHITGTKDKDYNIIWFVEQCLDNVLRLETYVEDARREGDQELADFFRRAQGESRKGADQGKTLLRQRLGG